MKAGMVVFIKIGQNRHIVQNKKSTDALSDDLFINLNPFGNKVKAIDAPEKKSCKQNVCLIK